MQYNVQSDRLLHKGGTKFYAIDIIEKADGSALVICGWGKVGTRGQLLCQMFSAGEIKKAHAFKDKKLNEKMSRGYASEAYADNAFATFSNSDALIHFLAPYWPILEDDVKNFLLAENGPDVVSPVEADVVSIDESYSDNPLFGRF